MYFGRGSLHFTGGELEGLADGDDYHDIWQSLGNRKALVLVHGLGGNFGDYWGDIPNILYSQFKPYGYDVISWGYDTSKRMFPSLLGVLKGCTLPSVPLISEALATFLGARKHYDSISLIGHSLGGAVIANALPIITNNGGRPKVNRVIMNATPLKKAKLASTHQFFSRGLNPQVKYLSSRKELELNLKRNVSAARKQGTVVAYMKNYGDWVAEGSGGLLFDDTFVVPGGHSWLKDVDINDDRVKRIMSFLQEGE